MSKPILCLDFDGVIHAYTSGWMGPAIIPDEAVPGAIEFIAAATASFTVAIFSSRSNQDGGVDAMRKWLDEQASNVALRDGETSVLGDLSFLELIEWPLEKPAAFITIDDRALTFDGTWPDLATLKEFKPWNKK